MALRSENTISKVVVTLLITLGVLGAISYFSFLSYQDFTDAADKLYENKDEITLSEGILAEIGQLETRARAYSLTESEEDLENYVDKVKSTKNKIDSLYFQSYGRNYHKEVDTLRNLFRQKVESFRELMELKAWLSRRQLDQSALNVLAKTQKVINKDSVLVPKQQITTTTVTRVETPVEEVEEEDKGGWLKGIFGKKEKPRQPVRSEVREEKTVAYDSAYFNKVDTLITSVEMALKEAEQARKYHSRVLTQTELDLVSRDQVIVEKIRTIILKIKELEASSVRVEKEEALATARTSFTSVSLFAICGGLLSIVLIFFVIRDIVRSNRMQTELSIEKARAERLASVKEEFLANMSHEIRTPLNSILGFSEQMDDEEMSSEQHFRLRKIRSSGEHLLMLVNDILDYSKIESGKLRLEKIGFAMSTVISESLATLEHLARGKGIELRSHIDNDLQKLVLKGDPIRLKQILINLAGNGVKFTDNGYVKISANLIRRTDKNVGIEFLVEDTGKGIEPSKLETIFEEFDQEDNSISRRYGGTGLGLAICRKLVQLQDGSIGVDSEVGQGSSFKVRLNYELAVKDEYSGKFDPGKVEINLQGRTLLLIDDDTMNHVLLKPSFKRWGLKFDSAYDGNEGVDYIQKNTYDYILIDLQMPGKDGLEVIREISNTDNPNKEATLILCTANAMVSSYRPEVMNLVDATLLKPFKEYEVAALLAGFAPKNKPNLKPNKMNQNQLEYSLSNFKTYAGDDPGVLKQFLESFIETNEENLLELQRYFEASDCQNVGDTAHKMKNTFGQLEATAVMEQLIELEKLVDSEQPRKLIHERIQKTQQYARKIFEMLKVDIYQLENESQTSNP